MTRPPSGPQRPLRVLHVVGSLERGGVENWLRHVSAAADPRDMQIDVVTHVQGDGAYGQEMRARGVRLFPCRLDQGRWRYQQALRRVLRTRGPYDVVHSHVHHFSGVVLALAALEGVPVRIAHAHTDSSRADARATASRRLYLIAMRHLVRRAGTAVCAASAVAGQSLTGEPWQDDARNRTLRCAIDLAPYAAGSPSTSVRSALGIPQDAVLIGHVGRFDAPKNHSFILEVASAAVRRDARVWVLLVGDGPTFQAVRRRAAALGLGGRTLLTGPRDDIPELLRAMDVFVLPSLFEGLPLVTVEAQAAGLPVVLSDSVSPESAVVPGLATFLSLDQPVERWAEVVLDAAVGGEHHPAPAEALAVLQASPFNVETGVQEMLSLYREGLRGAPPLGH